MYGGAVTWITSFSGCANTCCGTTTRQPPWPTHVSSTQTLACVLPSPTPHDHHPCIDDGMRAAAPAKTFDGLFAAPPNTAR